MDPWDPSGRHRAGAGLPDSYQIELGLPAEVEGHTARRDGRRIVPAEHALGAAGLVLSSGGIAGDPVGRYAAGPPRERIASMST